MEAINKLFGYAVYGVGPVKVGVIAATQDSEEICAQLQSLITHYRNLQIFLLPQGTNHEEVKLLIAQIQRPFALIVDMSMSGNILGGNGPGFEYIITKALGESCSKQTVAMTNDFFVSYSKEFELNSIGIGSDRHNKIKELDDILSYINGRK